MDAREEKENFIDKQRIRRKTLFMRSKAKKRWNVYGRKENSYSVSITFFPFFTRLFFLFLVSRVPSRNSWIKVSSSGGHPSNHPLRVFMSWAVSVCLAKDGLMLWSETERQVFHPLGTYTSLLSPSMITTSITVNILLLNGSETVVIYSLKWIVEKTFFSSLVFAGKVFFLLASLV